jgi:hypothetical protein
MRIPDDSSQVYDRRLIGSDRTKLINLTAPVTLSSAANSGGHCQNQGRLCFGNDWDIPDGRLRSVACRMADIPRPILCL